MLEVFVACYAVADPVEPKFLLLAEAEATESKMFEVALCFVFVDQET